MEKEIIEYCNSKSGEAGGIIRAGFFTPLENIADDKNNFFEFELDDWQDVSAIVHSHTESPFLSPMDRAMQVRSGVDWWVVYGNKIHKYKCRPLLRCREFGYGDKDCGTLIEDAFMLMGIDIGNGKRSNMQDDADNNVIINRLKEVGFYQVKDLEKGDVIVTSSQEEGNHLLFFIDEENVLHHAFNQLSKRINYNYLVRRRTHSIWRHKYYKPERMQAVLNDLEAIDL